jgi:cytidylate kinase
MKFKNIVISGDIGTGTSTLANNLAKALGWQVLSFGDFFREYVKENNIPLWDKLMVPASWEYKMDGDFHERMKKGEKMIFDGHYQGFLSRDLKDVFRILLVCDPKTAEERILQRTHTHEETPDSIQRRRQGLRDSFKKLYGDADYFDPDLYHLVIDTGEKNAEEALEIVMSEIRANQKDWC